MKPFYFYILLFTTLLGKAQVNLVPNPSFEDTVGGTCFVQMGIVPTSMSPGYTRNWYAPTNTSPDFYNICANSSTFAPYPNSASIPLHCRGYQYPHIGNSYAGGGIYNIWNLSDSTSIGTEPISVKIISPLKAGYCYYGEFYVSLSNFSNTAINQISMLLTQPIFTTSLGSFTNTIQPQIQWDTTKYFTDTMNWVKISGTFKALGGEQYLTIGNFKDGDHTKKQFISPWIFPTACLGTINPAISYIFIDDVALYELPTPQLGALNYTICNNSDSLVLGDTARLQTTYQWFANGVPISTSNTIIVKPSQTTNYVLQSTQCGVTNQTVVVTYSTNCEPVVVTEPVIPNVFTPNNDNVNDVFKFELNNSTLKRFTIYDRWGIEMLNVELKMLNEINWNGRTTSGLECTAGVYFYVLEYTDVNGDTHKENGYVTLIR